MINDSIDLLKSQAQSQLLNTSSSNNNTNNDSTSDSSQSYTATPSSSQNSYISVGSSSSSSSATGVASDSDSAKPSLFSKPPVSIFQFGSNNNNNNNSYTNSIPTFTFKPFAAFSEPVKSPPTESSFEFAKPFPVSQKLESSEQFLRELKNRINTLTNDDIFKFEKPRPVAVKSKLKDQPTTATTFSFSTNTNTSISKNSCQEESKKINELNLIANLDSMISKNQKMAQQPAKSEQQPPPPRNHVVVVEQAPFSVFKSVKSQEQAEEVCHFLTLQCPNLSNFNLVNSCFKSNNNLVVVNALRNHPYNNSLRPTILNNGNNNTSSTTDTTSSNNMLPPLTFNSKFPSVASSASASSSQQSNSSNGLIGSQKQQTTTTAENKSLSRNSSSNAILAHLKSLGPNFKSIFVRPKNTKHIGMYTFLNENVPIISFAYIIWSFLDPSLILNKQSKKTAQQQAEDASNRSFLNMLYSSKSSHLGANAHPNSAGGSSSSLIMKILPNTEPKELRLNQSVDDLLKKFATESNSIIKFITKSLQLLW
jgi:hypothetical protein